MKTIPFHLSNSAVPGRFSPDAGEPVYAVMPTGPQMERADLARNSIESFVRQTYQNRRLIVLNNGMYRFELNGVPEGMITQYDARQVRRTVGDLRNFALDTFVPSGAVWMVWDDDDWHHHEAMTMQYDFLVRTGKDACLLRNQIHYSMVENLSRFAPARQDSDGWLSTAMYRNHPQIRYPSFTGGEDGVYHQAYRARYGKIGVLENAGHLYVRVLHRNNGWLTHRRWKGGWLRKLKELCRKRVLPDTVDLSYLESVLKLYGNR